VREYRRELNLRHGQLRTCLVLDEERGPITIDQTIFASRANPHQAAIHMTLCPDFDGDIELLVPLEAAVSEDIETIDLGTAGQTIWLHARTRRYGIDVATSLTMLGDIWQPEDHAGQNSVSRRVRAAVRAGEQVELTQVVQVATSLECSEPVALVRRPAPPLDLLCREHESAWEQIWKTDIEIEGDPETQQFVRAALYYLWSTMRENDRWSIAPMGLSSNGYNGHIFWDAELWMYPSLLVTQPAMARSCLTYREQTMPAARERARAGGHDGVRFPWEGGFTGDEMTPEWAETRELQIHITADVAIAHWWYFLTTGDIDWLRDHAFPVMRECAAFWVSRAVYNAEKVRYEIRDVQCADEYAAGVDNDVFTNVAARLCLLLTAHAAELLGIPADDRWCEVADRIYVPYDDEHGRHIEYDGYNGQVTKQADVELLSYPLEYVTVSEQVARDLDYYATVIDPDGPAMSYSVYSVLSAQLGRADAAYSYLRRSFLPNTRPPFWAFSETPTNDEFHFCTGVGGALQAFLFGFTGLRLREGCFSLAPLLPKEWSALRLRHLFIQGARTDIEIIPGGLTLRRHLNQGSLVAEMSQSGEDTVLRVQWKNGSGGQTEVSVGDVEGGSWTDVAPVENGELRLPDYWQKGFRLRITDGSRELLHVLLQRLPSRGPRATSL
jgi:trehalose/maltose hydrolase-like predicted phosphorylase